MQIVNQIQCEFFVCSDLNLLNAICFVTEQLHLYIELKCASEETLLNLVLTTLQHKAFSLLKTEIIAFLLS